MANELDISRFTDADIAFGKSLTDTEGWHRTLADWKRLLAICPYGMFKARSGDKDVGVAGMVPYDKVAWIHSVIVVKEMRGQGIGKALMKACMQRAKDLSVPCIKLDCVGGHEGFYKSLGFVEEFESKRFVRDGEPLQVVAERIDHPALDRVIYFDQVMTGLNRSRAIKAIYEDAPELAFYTRGGSGVIGYVLARRCDDRIQIGPCVVQDMDAQCAARLITSLVGSEQYSGFRMCVPGSNEAAVRIATDLGFKMAPSSTRMFSGAKSEESNTCLAMISPEKG